ncbi:MAG TPA: GAF domain-containing protein [Nitrospira sp.]|nr:GAF domain-containing protein [Nitrospira sp.]
MTGMSAEEERELRKRAEARRQCEPFRRATHRLRTFEELTEELELHRIELEVQCEDLKTALADSEQHRDRYRQLYDQAPLPYVTTDGSGRILEVNAAARLVLGLENTCFSKPSFFQSFLGEQDSALFTRLLRQAVAGEGLGQCEVTLLPTTAVPRSARIHGICFTRSHNTFSLAITDVAELKPTEEHLRKDETGMLAELEDTQLLQQISFRLIENDGDLLCEDLIHAARSIMGSDMSSMQLLQGEGHLTLLAWEGFHPASAEFWKDVHCHSSSTCGAALACGSRVIVPDVEACDFMAGSQDLEEYRRSGIRAVQSTPLLSRTGTPLGMISTHWRQPHRPSERAFRLLDVLARQAADLIERATSGRIARERGAPPICAECRSHGQLAMEREDGRMYLEQRPF